MKLTPDHFFHPIFMFLLENSLSPTLFFQTAVPKTVEKFMLLFFFELIVFLALHLCIPGAVGIGWPRVENTQAHDQCTSISSP